MLQFSIGSPVFFRIILLSAEFISIIFIISGTGVGPRSPAFSLISVRLNALVAFAAFETREVYIMEESAAIVTVSDMIRIIAITGEMAEFF